MLLIAGLGNPGAQYAHHRHNVGFMAVDAIHRRHGFPAWRKKFQSLVSEGNIDGGRVLLLKPATFMNESGRAVREAAQFYKMLPRDILVIYDELDLAPGKIRMKQGGGHSGHNGLRSLHAHLGDGYRRLRIGIGHPGDKARVTKWVLGDFAKADRTWLDPLIDAIADAAPVLATGSDATFANKVHTLLDDGSERKPTKSDKREPAAKTERTRPADPAPSSANPFAEAFGRLFKGSDRQ
ncbi:MAG: aminoacyl-tRNA hydrolase [Pseudomonadota bacterium]